MSLDNMAATLGYVKRFAQKRIVFKLGGAALQNDQLVQGLCEDLLLLRSLGVDVIVVHGGGPAINQELTLRGISWEFIGGQRKTTPEMMQIIEMVLCGSVNRRIVRELHQGGGRAIGISGTDARTLVCRPAGEHLGQVGVVEKVNKTLLETILNLPTAPRTVPVVAPLGIGRDGSSYNVNADWAATHIAVALEACKLIFVTDQDGILNSDGKLLSELDAGDLEGLIEQKVVSGGMLAKTQTIIHALNSGITEVHVINGKRPHALLEELFTDHGVGSLCRMRARAAASLEVAHV